MRKSLKAWTALGAALATSTAAFAAGQQGHGFTLPANVHSHGAQYLIEAAGEGEGGEAHSDGDVEFLTHLGLVEGHLTVGVALYAMGEAEQSKTHMKHPQDEIYADLLPELQERGLAGFDNELSALAAAVEGGEDAASVQGKLATLVAAVAVTGQPENGRHRADTIVRLVRIAGEEYGVGVNDGRIVNAHEYQDAYGFVQAAKRLLADASDEEKSEYAAPLAEIGGYLDGLEPAWPDISGKTDVTTDASLLLAAAARIELVALGMK